MKFTKLILLVAMSAISLAATASDRVYSMCGVVGYFEGSGNQFMQEIALRVVEKNRLLTSPACENAIKMGKEVAIHHAKPGRVTSEAEAEVINHAEQFRNQVYDSILSRVKFD